MQSSRADWILQSYLEFACDGSVSKVGFTPAVKEITLQVLLQQANAYKIKTWADS